MHSATRCEKRAFKPFVSLSPFSSPDHLMRPAFWVARARYKPAGANVVPAFTVPKFLCRLHGNIQTLCDEHKSPMATAACCKDTTKPIGQYMSAQVSKQTHINSEVYRRSRSSFVPDVDEAAPNGPNFGERKIAAKSAHTPCLDGPPYTVAVVGSCPATYLRQ